MPRESALPGQIEERFERGASILHRGLLLAYAFPAEGRPPRVPDAFRWFVSDGAEWRLIDIRAVCRRAGAVVPLELTAPYFAAAYREWIEAAARCLVSVTVNTHPPIPTATPQPRPWWLFD